MKPVASAFRRKETANTIRIFLAALVGMAAVAVPRASGDEPALKEVVRRLAAYVDAYGEHASIVVATERYEQNFARKGEGNEHRVLVSEFAIVKTGDGPGWTGFRDVIEVDGRRVTDRQDRLVQVLTASDPWDEARRLAEESARFNIGPVLRTFNVPTTALFFFSPVTLDRFHFTRQASVAGGIWQIAFREKEKPTLVRTPDGRSLPLEGRIQLNPADGTIVRTDMRLRDYGPPSERATHDVATITVTYERVAALGMWLPATMSELYESNPGGLTPERVTGDARYTNYRRFQTSGRIK